VAPPLETKMCATALNLETKITVSEAPKNYFSALLGLKVTNAARVMNRKRRYWTVMAYVFEKSVPVFVLDAPWGAQWDD
jgi:hypothetical protein